MYKIMLRALLVILLIYQSVGESIGIIASLVLNHDNYDFVEDTIKLIGDYSYESALELIIDSADSQTEGLDIIIDVIANLASHTDIEMLVIWHERMPYLSHLLQYPINKFDYRGNLTDESLSWFLSQYKPSHLDQLLHYDMHYISKPLLQSLVDMAVRDYKYIDYVPKKFIAQCIDHNLDISNLS